jgi:hypothetical protein
MKRSNVRGAKGPCHLQSLRHREGKDEMIKASIDLQDLRRRIYVKAKAEPSWRFWGFAQKRRGLGWARWSRPWLHGTLKLFNSYRVRCDGLKVAPA